MEKRPEWDKGESQQEYNRSRFTVQRTRPGSPNWSANHRSRLHQRSLAFVVCKRIKTRAFRLNIQSVGFFGGPLSSVHCKTAQLRPQSLLLFWSAPEEHVHVLADEKKTL